MRRPLVLEASVRRLGLLGIGLTLGCGIVVQGEELGEQSSVEDDLLEYEQLVEALESDRDQALAAEVTDVQTHGPWLASIEDATLGLRRYPDQLELELPAPSSSVRISETAVVTLERIDAEWVVRGYGLPDGELLDQQSLADSPDPPAVALADQRVWIVHEDQVSTWALGVESPTELGSLASAGIEDVIEVIDKLEVIDQPDADGPQLILHADARLWRLDLASFTAVEIATEVDQVDQLLAVGPRGVLFTHDAELHLHQLDGETLRIDSSIAETGWSLNATFTTIHEYTGDGATLIDDRVIYIGSAGVFAYALDELGPAAIVPLLLEPRWDVGAGIDRVEYRDPRVAGDYVFVRGLTDAHGEVGSTGPIFLAPLER